MVKTSEKENPNCGDCEEKTCKNDEESRSTGSCACFPEGSELKHSIPEKKIRTQEHVVLFSGSKIYREIVKFLGDMSIKVKGQPIEVSWGTPSAIIWHLVKALDTLESWTIEFPPIAQTMRYGNRAFQSWWDKMCQNSEELLMNILPRSYWCAIKELQAYFLESFGNRTRIDYGNGHEFSFCCFLFCLFKIGVLSSTNPSEIVLIGFKRYLDLMRHLQIRYLLEPAGSRGVWGLDDYHFLPFLWGSAQLQDQNYIPPSRVTDKEILVEYSNKYMYIDAIKFIMQMKKNVPFGECSPVLNDITAVPTWNKVNSGLLKMYQVEVLQKLPVAQHFLFGSIIPFPY